MSLRSAMATQRIFKREQAWSLQYGSYDSASAPAAADSWRSKLTKCSSSGFMGRASAKEGTLPKSSSIGVIRSSAQGYDPLAKTPAQKSALAKIPAQKSVALLKESMSAMSQDINKVCALPSFDGRSLSKFARANPKTDHQARRRKSYSLSDADARPSSNLSQRSSSNLGQRRNSLWAEPVASDISIIANAHPRRNSSPGPDPGSKEIVAEAAPTSELVWISRKNNISLDMCKFAAEIYCTEARDIHESLSPDQFGKLLVKLADKTSLDELGDHIVHHSFNIVDKNANGRIEFAEFVVWLSAFGFNPNFFVSEDERLHRSFCQKHGLNLNDVDMYKRHFDEFDTDNSGEIEEDEFEALIRKCDKVPDNIEIPRTRFESLWREADIDGGGTIDFQEFTIFYKKYFTNRGGLAQIYDSFLPPAVKAVNGSQ